MTSRVGVFGGTFDPIHIGHLAAVEDAASGLALDRVIFVPNRQPPHKVELPVSPAADRVAMVKLAISDNPRFSISLIEQEREGLSHIIDTLRQLQDELGQEEQIVFLAGADALNDLHGWYRPHDLLREFCMGIMDRPLEQTVQWSEVEREFPEIRRQIELVHVAQLAISGQDIRRRVHEGLPIRYHVLPQVAEYIAARGLYRGGTGGEAV